MLAMSVEVVVACFLFVDAMRSVMVYFKFRFFDSYGPFTCSHLHIQFPYLLSPHTDDIAAHSNMCVYSLIANELAQPCIQSVGCIAWDEIHPSRITGNFYPWNLAWLAL